MVEYLETAPNILGWSHLKYVEQEVSRQYEERCCYVPPVLTSYMSGDKMTSKSVNMG